MIYKSDILIVGTGLSGLWLALKLGNDYDVTMICKDTMSETNTSYAQGGIAAVMADNDSIENHIEDTLVAGAGLCKLDAVSKIIGDAPRLIKELINYGVNFSKTNKDYELGMEGGHSHRRILHKGDTTGLEIQKALVAAVRKNPRIRIMENHAAIDLVLSHKIDPTLPRECLGAFVLDKVNRQIHTFVARSTILATGGAGKIYLYTSNPDSATGDGMAMAYRAGAQIANLEFVQFHPTSLYNPGAWAPRKNTTDAKAKNFLISEAVRGEGALLRHIDGSSFMEKYHPQKELAPRDVVARAIDQEMKITGDDCVVLDISHKSSEFIKERFPHIYNVCKQNGFDITQEPIPVVPAAHYICGGVLTDLQAKTNIPRLFAIGETACTGLHGANRLASNSLLECLATAEYCFNAIEKDLPSLHEVTFPQWSSGKATDIDEAVVISHNWDEIRRLLWNYVGIVRTDKRLIRAKHRMDLLQEEIKDFYWNFRITPDLIDLRNVACVASLIVECAMARKESRGIHYNLDHPQLVEGLNTDTIVQKKSTNNH